MLGVYFIATWHTLQPKLKKIRKKLPRKKFPLFQEMELLSSNSKKIQEMEAPKKKFLIFQGTETLKKFLIFQKIEPFSPPGENFLYFKKQKP